MKLLALRHCIVSPQAPELLAFLDALGLDRKALDPAIAEDFVGGIFPAGESWIEVWAQGPEMPAGTMLQLVVDDADAFAMRARSQGLEVQGPVEAHGERIYFAKAPTGLAMSFQSVVG